MASGPERPPARSMGHLSPRTTRLSRSSSGLSEIHYLALVCDDEVLEERLRSRPEWRRSRSPEFIDGMKVLNNHLKGLAQGPDNVTALDTGTKSLEESVQEVRTWLQGKLS